MTYDVAVVGTGPDPSSPGRDGFAMGYRHARAYEAIDGCSLVACADIVPENASAFAEAFDLPDENVFEDHERLLGAVDPDVVSVCVPPAVHADIVADCADHGVRAVHCEKPMADTWLDCRRMVDACERAGTQLTINHQRRFGEPFRAAKRELDAIGDLRRIEFTEVTMFDAGTHQLDLARYYTDGAPVEWVLGQVDYSEENRWFGTPNATHGLAQWRYADGTMGIARTGQCTVEDDPYFRLVGTDGAIEIGVPDGPSLRVQSGAGGWRPIPTNGETIHGRASPGYVGAAVRKARQNLPLVTTADRSTPLFVRRAIADALDALGSDRTPELAGSGVLASTEVVFAAWESARRRGRVVLPLDVDDNPLAAMIDAGQLRPRAETGPDVDAAVGDQAPDGDAATDGGR